MNGIDVTQRSLRDQIGGLPTARRPMVVERTCPGGAAFGRRAAAVLLVGAVAAAWMASGCTHQKASVAPTPPAGGLGKLAYVVDNDIWVKGLPDGTPRRRHAMAGLAC